MNEPSQETKLRYINADSNDEFIDDFLTDFTEAVMGSFVSKVELFSTFKEFCEKCYAVKLYYLNMMSFGRIMARLGYISGRRMINDKRCRVWLGIKMLSSEQIDIQIGATRA